MLKCIVKQTLDHDGLAIEASVARVSKAHPGRVTRKLGVPGCSRWLYPGCACSLLHRHLGIPVAEMRYAQPAKQPKNLNDRLFRPNPSGKRNSHCLGRVRAGGLCWSTNEVSLATNNLHTVVAEPRSVHIDRKNNCHAYQRRRDNRYEHVLPELRDLQNH